MQYLHLLGLEIILQCKIDLISQAWAAIALKGYPDTKDEINSSLESAEKYLVDRKHNVIKLLNPPLFPTSFPPQSRQIIS